MSISIKNDIIIEYCATEIDSHLANSLPRSWGSK